MPKVRYAIKNREGDYYSSEYTFEGNRYAVFDDVNFKKYKSKMMAEKVMNRLSKQCMNVREDLGYKLDDYYYYIKVVEVEE